MSEPITKGASQDVLPGPASLQDDTTLPVTPEISGRYDLRGEHGRGGQSVVLLAYDAHIGREVALKELLPERALLARANEPHLSTYMVRFLREARITGQLEHPSIVPVYEVGRRKDGRLYYTQKLVRGRTLRAALDDCRDLTERLRLLPHFVDMCQALAYAHGRGVIHRDLKPANVMVGEFGETVVLDWGLAKVKGHEDLRHADLGRSLQLLRDADGRTVDGTVLGTPEYMSPEQAHGTIESVDERSDVFSLGAILYEILGGRLPFEGATPLQVLYRVCHESPRPIRELASECPAELIAVVERALQKKAGDRYQSARELAGDIEAYLTGGRVGAHDYSSWELARRFVAKNRTFSAVSLAALVFLLITGGIIWRAEREARSKLAETLVWRGQAAEREQQWARAAAYYAAARVQQDRADARWGLALVEGRGARPQWTRGEDCDGWVGFSPDGRLVASTAGTTLVLRDVATGETRASLPGDGKVLGWAALSPDGNLAATTATHGQDIQLWDLRTHGLLRTLRGHTDGVEGFTFSPDGKVLVSASQDHTSRVWDLTTGAERARLTLPGTVNAAVFAPDGKQLALAGEDGLVVLWDGRAEAPIARFEGHDGDVLGLAFSPDGATLASAGFDKSVRIWDLAARKQVARFEMGMSATSAAGILAFSVDGRWLASPGPDGSLIVWDVALRQPVLRNDAHRGDVTGLAFGRDGTLASTGLDGRLRLWGLAAAFEARGLDGTHAAEAKALAFSGDGALLASAGFDKSIRLWDGVSGAPRGRIDGPVPFLAAAFSPDGRALAAAGLDGAITLWSVPAGTKLSTLHLHGAPVIDVRFSPAGDSILFTAADQKVARVDLAGPRLRWAGEARVSFLALSADGSMLAARRRGGVRLLDAETGTERNTFDTPEGTNALAFSPDGRRIVTGSKASELRLRDVRTGAILWRVPGPSGVQAIAFSPDGRFIAAAGATVDLIDASTGARLSRREGAEGYATDAAFSPDGKRLATAGLDGSIRVLHLDGADEVGAPEAALQATLRLYGLRLDGVQLAQTQP